MDNTSTNSIGFLSVFVRSVEDSTPITNAIISVYASDNPSLLLFTETTNAQGQITPIALPTPSKVYSEAPSETQPYQNYIVQVSAPDYEEITIVDLNILPGVEAIQNFFLLPKVTNISPETEEIVIPPNTLYGNYPEKIAEAETKSLQETGEIVLSRVVIPEYIIVHDGVPSDKSAKNYYVKYKDYIKNVASSEIYANWPEAAIIANILAIQSFTLNRVYTEWYRNKNYPFTITSSTAYDQKWVYNRNIFEPIFLIVDSIFDQYLSRPGIVQPILTQYCDGNRVKCPNWLSQWGSKDLASQGYSAQEIIKYYYGDNMGVRTAEEISGIPSSWPGADLTIGSSGAKVQQLQRQLNAIANAYPLIPKIAEDSVYGEKTAEAVRVFQQIFGLPETGVTDFTTWYKISEIYVGVNKIAELV